MSQRSGLQEFSMALQRMEDDRIWSLEKLEKEQKKFGEASRAGETGSFDPFMASNMAGNWQNLSC